METREPGRSGLTVSAIGLGCMGMSEFYGGRDEDESIATIHHALDKGVTLLDTADMYGVGHNEELVGRAIRLRGEPQAPGRRGDRPLLSASGRSRAASGRGRRTSWGRPRRR